MGRLLHFVLFPRVNVCVCVCVLEPATRTSFVLALVESRWEEEWQDHLGP